MPESDLSVHTATPTLTAHDPRGLVVCKVDFCRTQPDTSAAMRMTRQRFDCAARRVACQDPRLGQLTEAGNAFVANLVHQLSLSGLSLRSQSVDAGWRVRLFGEARELRVEWDSLGQMRHSTFDDSLRLTAVSEQSPDGTAMVAERLVYAPPAESGHNLCGHLIRHDDGVGSHVFLDYGLQGSPLVEQRRFLQNLDAPDWPLEIDARDAMLEAETAMTQRGTNALGEQIRQIDARHNIQRFHHDIAGHVSQVSLQLSDAGPLALSLLSFNAFGQIERETSGNGVVTQARYSAQDGRLLRLEAPGCRASRLCSVWITCSILWVMSQASLILLSLPFSFVINASTVRTVTVTTHCRN